MALRDSWHEERQSEWLYARLAEAERDPRVAGLFRQLATAAAAQARHWEALMGHIPRFVPTPRARLAAGLVGRMPPRRLRPLLRALKVRGLSAYDAAPSGHASPQRVEDIGHRHRGPGGGSLRAAVFGINDGLVSNASLILGMVGAGSGDATVLAAGVAGLLAGALSMAAGEYVSVRSQRELFEYQIGLEREELAEYPEAEAEELALIYAARGIDPADAKRMADQLVAHPEQALDVLAREELGLNPDDLGSPWGAAISSFLAFAVGATLPLLPFLLGGSLPTSAYVGGALSAVGLFATGAAMSLFSGRNALVGGARMLAIGGGAGALTFAIGHLLGGVVG
ncbi:MAG: VIT1/CCC1 transporter family protein [Lysobacteraceae bacterium]|jgi:VIT1/CCC1 family predicted Fe2+/Mn2+ transporter|nr:VIT1/CCC1 transporter family protein [Silanimonas sp.]